MTREKKPVGNFLELLIDPKSNWNTLLILEKGGHDKSDESFHPVIYDSLSKEETIEIINEINENYKIKHVYD